jgi:tRNA threonylcarbamoyladenosine biosynthesis protein TsaE
MPKVSHTSKQVTKSPSETMVLAGKFAKDLKAGDIVFLQGELGAGKTVFMKGLAQAFKVDPKNVSSPTFVLMNMYEGKIPLYHFDLYRLEKPEELNSVQFDEYFYGEGISIIEWPQRLGNLAPQKYWLVELAHKGVTEREICITSP